MEQVKTEVQLRCPNCGNERIVEWSRVLSYQDFDKVVRNEKGELEITDWGASEMVWEDYDHYGFSCGDLCEGPNKFFPLEYFVVKEA